MSNFKMSPSFENHFWNQNLKIQISGKQNHEYSYGLMKHFTPYPLDSIRIYCSKVLFYHHWSSFSAGVFGFSAVKSKKAFFTAEKLKIAFFPAKKPKIAFLMTYFGFISSKICYFRYVRGKKLLSLVSPRWNQKKPFSPRTNWK